MIEVHIADRWEASALDVYVIERGHPDRVLSHTEEGMSRWIEVDPAVALPLLATYRIPMQAAHALLGALAHQLGAVEHPEQLRRDYEHERARVDKMLDHVLHELSK